MTPKDHNEFRKAAFERNPPGTIDELKSYTVGIAGAGGLGSNVATSLVRAGIENLVVADFDKIEMSNLNRQQYVTDQVGEFKVEALKENLLKINPFASIEIHSTRIEEDNVHPIFGRCEIMVEAFDTAACKAMLANTWPSLFPDRALVMASGLAGFGNSSGLKIHTLGNIFICGDLHCESSPATGLIAPRVAIAANMQANVVLEYLLTKKVTL